MRVFYVLLLYAAAVMAQTPQAPPTAAVNASITGVVRDKSTSLPLKDYQVTTDVSVPRDPGDARTGSTTTTVVSTTDDAGRYTLHDLPAGQYRVLAQAPRDFGGGMTRHVVVAGRDVEGIDFNVIVSGTIRGKVVDENKEPVPGIWVLLVSKEYYLGSIGYFIKGTGITNDQGEYSITHLEAGRAYYLVTDVRRRDIPPHSDVPLNPAMRRRIPMRTWYPSSPDRNGAAPLILQPGEKREGVDIEVKKSASYCIAGVASAPNGPAALRIAIEGLQPSSGTSSSGGMFMMSTGTTTGSDGEFRFCELYPGSFRMTVSEPNPGPSAMYSVATVRISDQDLSGLKLGTTPGLQLDAEVVLEGPVPQIPIAVKANVSLRPLLRTQMPGEKTGGRPDIPGTIALSGLLIDDYAVFATVNSPGLYVKDVTYSDRSVRYEPLHLGSASGGSGLRVTIGQDGGTIAAKVADKDGNPVADTNVILMPAGMNSEGALAARIVSGQTDSLGVWTSGTLAPGKYFVVATLDSYDMTPESIGRLWQSHTRYQEVELGAKGSAQVLLAVVGIR